MGYTELVCNKDNFKKQTVAGFPCSLLVKNLPANAGNTGLISRKGQSLDSILKSRDLTLPTKVCIFKAMVFPVVMYGYESWTIKKAECQRIDALNCGVGEDS